ncbi:hypothetical protein CR513_18897, partial [Mucuna pruriens]
MFVKSIEFIKTRDKVYQILNSFIEEIGEKNVIQVMTNNESNYVMPDCQSKKGYTKRHQTNRLHLEPFNGFEHHAEVH